MEVFSSQIGIALVTRNDLRIQPAYPLAEAARYLWLPPATLRSWVLGRDYRVGGATRRFAPLIKLPEPRLSQMSFLNLVEAHVLSAFRREHQLPLKTVRRAISYLQESFRSQHPLAEHRFETDGLEIFVTHLGTLISASGGGQIAMRELISSYLKRVEWDDAGMAARLYPFTRRAGGSDDPKIVVIDPRISFGRRSIAGTGIATALVAERYKAGESIPALASDYGCKDVEIDEAIRCELSLAA